MKYRRAALTQHSTTETLRDRLQDLFKPSIKEGLNHDHLSIAQETCLDPDYKYAIVSPAKYEFVNIIHLREHSKTRVAQMMETPG